MACRDLGYSLHRGSAGAGWRRIVGHPRVFSSVPHAFSDSDLQALQSLSRKISDTVREAIDGGSQTVASGSSLPSRHIGPDDRAGGIRRVRSRCRADTAANRLQVRLRGRDYRTGALTVAVLALAVLLGWMVGRVGWSMAVNRAPAQIPITPEETQAARDGELHRMLRHGRR